MGLAIEGAIKRNYGLQGEVGDVEKWENFIFSFLPGPHISLFSLHPYLRLLPKPVSERTNRV
jgi:hypothetical protein